VGFERWYYCDGPEDWRTQALRNARGLNASSRDLGISETPEFRHRIPRYTDPFAIAATLESMRRRIAQ
jgi:hypothetical protein